MRLGRGVAANAGALEKSARKSKRKTLGWAVASAVLIALSFASFNTLLVQALPLYNTVSPFLRLGIVCIALAASALSFLPLLRSRTERSRARTACVVAAICGAAALLASLVPHSLWIVAIGIAAVFATLPAALFILGDMLCRAQRSTVALVFLGALGSCVLVSVLESIPNAWGPLCFGAALAICLVNLRRSPLRFSPPAPESAERVHLTPLVKRILGFAALFASSSGFGSNIDSVYHLPSAP